MEIMNDGDGVTVASLALGLDLRRGKLGLAKMEWRIFT